MGSTTNCLFPWQIKLTEYLGDFFRSISESDRSLFDYLFQVNSTVSKYIYIIGKLAPHMYILATFAGISSLECPIGKLAPHIYIIGKFADNIIGKFADISSLEFPIFMLSALSFEPSLQSLTDSQKASVVRVLSS
jgi:hypothetical protein